MAIASLFNWCGPSAIAGLVIAIFIRPAIKSFTEWPLAHVGEEILKYQPAVTDHNAMIDGWMITALGSRDHCIPRFISSGMATAPRMAMFPMCFVVQTSTGARPSGSQATKVNDCFLAAVTTATPI